MANVCIMVHTMNNQTPYTNVRIPHVEPLKPRSIKLEDSLWEVAKHIGNGNASAGIRAILRGASQREDSSVGEHTPNS